MKYSNIPLIIQAPMDANVVSAVIDFNQLIKMSAQVIVSGSGSVSGNLQLQVSNDICTNQNPKTFLPANWSNLGSPTALSGQGVSLVAQQDMCYRWLRASYIDFASDPTSFISVNLMVLSV